MTVTNVDGVDRGDIMLYALSTCVWCKKTKALLDELKVKFSFTFVDLLNKEEKAEAMQEVRKWNPACSFPSMVINNSTCIVGFDEEKIREALKG
ncbi:MAG: glutaredoxin family protein [Syntrophaceae bacterium]